MRIAKNSWTTGITDSLLLGSGHFGNLHHRSVCRLVQHYNYNITCSNMIWLDNFLMCLGRFINCCFGNFFFFIPLFHIRAQVSDFQVTLQVWQKEYFQKAKRNQGCNGFYALVLICQQSNDGTEVRLIRLFFNSVDIPHFEINCDRRE